MLNKKEAKKNDKKPNLGSLPVVSLNEKEMSNVSGGAWFRVGP
ncbi:bacteriocin [Nostoc sp. TCL26-01]|nr:bacteriocin [Nostoc sp. TCL26-01]QLE57982.1 bacteriocin [Nostoc sp. TCL26-01]